MPILRRTLLVLTSLVVLINATAAFAQLATSTHVHSGIFRGRRVTYQMRQGKMIFEGDIALEHVDQKISEGLHASGTLAYLQHRWPKVGSVYQIPYTIDPTSGDVTNINAAISNYNTTFSGIIQWVPQTTEANYVNFKLDPNDTSGVGNSYIGQVGGGPQLIWGSGSCTVPTLLHEMGHATGLWHEQSRPDSANYVYVNLANIVNVEWFNSTQQFDDMQEPTLYDWSSLMHYGAHQFTKNGNTTNESIPAGMPLSNNVGYSSSDIDGIKRLYQAVPTAVTIATNPAGLQVTVDGMTVTTPRTFSWPLFSSHRLVVPTNAQTLNSIPYTFGRWNDDGAQTHNITVLPGNGTVAKPANAPGVTVYEASFIQLVAYAMTIAPTGTGTVTPTPAPQSYPGLTGGYFVARLPVTLTATPNTGQNFYQFINSPYWLPGGLSVNPKTFDAMDDGTTVNLTTYFAPTSSPIYTLSSDPHDSNFYVIADGNYWPSPMSFSPFYDSSWSAGSNHTIGVDPTQWPWTFNSRWLFGSWSDGGAQSHSVTLPSSSTTYAATLNPQYYLSDYANEGCAGSVGVTPSSPTGDGFYPGGTLLTFTATPVSGWTFTEWQNSLTGTNSSENITMNDELLVSADFNTTSAPLTLTGLSPSSAIQGGGAFTLTLNGTGFTPTSVLFVNNTFRANTFVNANKITVAMTATDLATAGAFQIFVQNDPPGNWGCAPYQALPFTVAGSPIVKPTPLSLGFGALPVGTTSAAKPVTFRNTSKAMVSINSLAATGDYTIASTTCGSSLAAGASCTAHVTFTPAVGGSLPGSLALSDSAPDSPQIVAFSGTGSLPLTIAPTTLAFGTVAVGSTSASKIVTLTSNQVSTLSFSSAASGNYAISSTGTTCTGSLAPAAKCNLAVIFSPTTAGAINGAVTITDATEFSPQLVRLSGTGSGGSTPPLTFTPASLIFPVQAVGSTSATKTVTVKNVSAGSITLNSLGTSGEFAVADGGTRPCAAGLHLAANTACTMVVTFAPAFGTNGVVNGAVVISDTGSVGQQVLDVKGTAALPVSFAPTTLAFAAQNVATSSTAQTVTLTNNLATSLSPTIVGNADYAAAPGGATPCTGTLAAHTKCTFTIVFTPTAIGKRTGAITVTDSANPGTQIMSLSGTGQ